MAKYIDHSRFGFSDDRPTPTLGSVRRDSAQMAENKVNGNNYSSPFRRLATVG